MGSMSATEVLDRLSSFGCQVRVEGDKLKVRGPDRPEVEELVSEDCDKSERRPSHSCVTSRAGPPRWKRSKPCCPPASCWFRTSQRRFLSP